MTNITFFFFLSVSWHIQKYLEYDSWVTVMTWQLGDSLLTIDYITGFFSGSHSCGTLPWLFLMGSELHVMEIRLYGTHFRQATCKFLLDLSNKGAIESNSNYIKYISRKKESVKCPTAIGTSGKPCIQDKSIGKRSNPSWVSTKLLEMMLTIESNILEAHK